MYSGNNNMNSRHLGRRQLQVEWLEANGATVTVPLSVGRILRGRETATSRLFRPFLCGPRSRPARPSSRAFTILEMMVVIAIIGLIAAMALPHLGGFTKGNTGLTATRQLLDDVALARQRAIVNRSEVCMVFLPQNFWLNDFGGPFGNGFANNQVSNLVAHQFSAYALIATRTVGDQPGRSNAHYITDWKYLPQGIYVYPWQLTNSYGTNLISTTNTTTGISNGWFVTVLPTNIAFPFPSSYVTNSNNLPYIGFNPSGQLAAGSDQFIALSTGSIFVPPDAAGNPQWVTPMITEAPVGNVTNSPNLIHIDWLTGRATLERNQF